MTGGWSGMWWSALELGGKVVEEINYDSATAIYASLLGFVN